MDRRTALYVLVPYLLLVGFHVYLSLPLTAPTVVDELGYLGNARFLATGDGLVDPAGRAAYKLGYSVFLIPAFILGQDPELGFRWALCINSLLVSMAYPAVFVFLGQIRPTLTLRERALGAMALNLHPAPVLYGLSTMSANAFIPLYCWLAVAFFAAVQRSRWWAWALAGTVAASLYAVHERAFGIALLIGGAALTYPLVRRRRFAVAALAAFPAGALVLGATRALSPSGATYPSDRSSQILQRVLADPEVVLAELAGQGIYVTLSSLALVLLALTGGLVVWLKRQRLLEGSALFWWVWSATGLSVFAISVLFMAPQGRNILTFLIYGRYNEGVILPFMAIALALFHGVSRSPDRWRSTAIAAGAAMAMTFAGVWVLFVTRKEVFSQAPYYFNVLATFVVRKLGVWSLQDLPWVLGAILLVVALGLGRRWLAAVQALLLVFSVVTVLTYFGFWRPFSGARAKQGVLADVVRQLPDSPERLLYDRRWFPNFHYFNYSYLLPDQNLVRVDLTRLETPKDDLVISGQRDLSTTIPGARLVAMENVPRDYGSYVQYLWVLPGELQGRLAEAGWLFPAEFPEQVLCRRPRSHLEIVSDKPASVIWKRKAIRVRIMNAGPCPWPNAVGLGSGRESVRVGIVWYRADGSRDRVAEDRVELARVLLPGQSIEVRVPLVPPALRGSSHPPGRWIVEIGLVHEGHAWFASWGEKGIRLGVEG